MTNISATIAQSVNQRIANGSIWGIFGTGSGRVMNLLAMILSARILGAEGFGGFALVQSTLGLFGMFAGAALGSTATRFIAATHRTNPERTGRIAGLVTGSAIVSAMLFGTVIIALAPWLARTVLDAPELASATALGALLVSAGVIRGVQDATLAGFEAFQKIALLRFLEGGATLLLMSAFVEQFGPAGGVAALSFGLLVALVPGVFLVRWQLNIYGVVPLWQEGISEWRLLRDFSAPTLLAVTVATPVLWVCVLLLSRTPGGLAELGVYNAAYQWHGPLVFVPMVIASVSLPILAHSWENENNRAFRKLFVKVLTLGLILALAPAVLATALSPQIITFYGEEFRSGAIVFPLLLLAAPFHVASNIATSAIQSMNRSWYLVAFHALWGTTLITIALFTIDKRGAEGLAIAFFASYCVLAISKSAFVLWQTAKTDDTQTNSPTKKNT